MKKIIVFALCLLGAVLAGIDKKPEDKIIQLSKIEWNAVKECVDTNGYCRIVGQDAVIVITNGLPEIDCIFPYIEDRLEINRLRIEECRRKKDPYKPRLEPTPYIGQGGW